MNKVEDRLSVRIRFDCVTKKTNKRQIQSNSGLNMIEVYFSFKHKSLSLEHSLMSGTQNLFSFLLIHVCPWLTVYGGGIHILEIRVEEI